MRKLPARYGPTLFAFLLTGVMSLLVSSLAVIRQVGWVDGLPGLTLRTWLPAWAVAFVVALLLVKPLRQMVDRWVQPAE